MKNYCVSVFFLLLLAGCQPSVGQPTEANPPPRRPNIILVLADDWSYPHASIYGDPVVRTPNFDRIARQGVLFTNAYCAAPSCTPSRAALLTGRYPHALQQGANLWGTLPVAYPNFTSLLEEAGYQVVFQEKGWAPGNYRPGGYARNPAGHETENFEHFVEETGADQPFFLWYGTRDPHRPYTAGLGRASGMRPEAVVLPSFWPSDSVVRSDVLDYYYEVQRLDYDLGRLLFRLKRNGQLDNTLIVVTSDNGMPFPRAKANCYDLGTRMPMAIFWARYPNSNVEKAFVNLIDLAPTFLDAAGVAVPEAVQGRSLLPLLNGEEDTTARRQVFLERERHAYARLGNLSYPVRAVRDSQFLLIHNLIPNRWPAGDPLPDDAPKGFGDIDHSPTKQWMIEEASQHEAVKNFYDLSTGKRPEYELYDIQQDTFQVHNLAPDPAYDEVLTRYQNTLLEWRRRTGDRMPIREVSPFDRYEYYGRVNDLLTPAALDSIN